MAALHPSVRRLGWVSFLNDAASEMIYPMLPAFLATLGATPLTLGALEGFAEATASLVRVFSGRLSDRRVPKKPLIVAGYLVSNLVRPLIALVTGTANIWLAAVGAKTTGASWRTLVVGFIGAIAGTFLIPIPLLGTILGYAGGLILAEYVRLNQWRPALKAAFGGVVGWGVSTAVELIGAVMMILLVATQVPR